MSYLDYLHDIFLHHEIHPSWHAASGLSRVRGVAFAKGCKVVDEWLERGCTAADEAGVDLEDPGWNVRLFIQARKRE